MNEIELEKPGLAAVRGVFLVQWNVPRLFSE